MNAPVDQSAFAATAVPNEPHIEFELARGRLLREFFELDVAVTKWLRFLGEKDSAKPLGQKLEQLANHALLSKKAGRNQIKQIKELESDCDVPLKIRNAAVHSTFEAGTRGGEACALLKMTGHAVDESHERFVVTFAEMDQAAKDAKRLAGRLMNYLSQASSPPRPSPVAAAGP